MKVDKPPRVTEITEISEKIGLPSSVRAVVDFKPTQHVAVPAVEMFFH